MARHAKKKKSRALISMLSKALRNARDAEEPLYCWRIKEIGMDYSEAQRATMNEAQNDLYNAVNKAKSVYAELIGKAVVEEIAIGDWKDG